MIKSLISRYLCFSLCSAGNSNHVCISVFAFFNGLSDFPTHSQCLGKKEEYDNVLVFFKI